MKKKICFLLVIASVLALCLAGCVAAAKEQPIIGGKITGATLNEPEAGGELPFDIKVKQTGEVVGVHFSGNLVNGNLHVRLQDGEGQTVWQEDVEQAGFFQIRTTLNELAPGDYKLGIAWDNAVNATYELQWLPQAIEPIAVTPWTFLSGAGMLVVAIVFLVYAWQRRLGWRYLLLGAIAWVVTVALKFAWAIPINPIVYNLLVQSGNLPEWLGSALLYIYIGSLTGIFEMGVAYLFLRFTRFGRVSWERALAYGIGFGAVEAALLAISPLALALTGLLTPQALPLSALEQVEMMNQWIYGIMPVWERFFVVWIHIFCSVLMFYSISTRQMRWFWLSFAYKSLIDAVAAYAQVSGILVGNDIWRAMLVLELVIGAWGMLAWWGTRRVAAVYPVCPETQAPEAEQPAAV